MDIRGIIDDYEDFVAKRMYAEGGEFLLAAAEAAEAEGDTETLFAVWNELIGHCRKNDDREGCYRAIERVKELTPLAVADTDAAAGTAWVNVATGYNRFGDTENAILYYEKALAVYEKTLGRRDPRMGALMNNYATALQAAGRLDEAEMRFEFALKQMAALDKREDEAVTYVNIAHLKEDRGARAEEITRCLDRAYYLLDTVRERGSYYAFVCSKCAPSFLHFGDKRGEILNERAEKIYSYLAEDR